MSGNSTFQPSSRCDGSPRTISAAPFCAGFTLVELLVSIAVIAVLVSIAIPTINYMGDRSRAAHCIGNLRAIGSALNLYLSEHNNVMPTMVMGRESTSQQDPSIDTVLLEYVGNKEVFHCKGDNKRLFETTGASYHWNSLLNGQNNASLDFMGLVKSAAGIPVVSDKENFHKYQDVEVNILYADGHVAKELQFHIGGK